MLGLVAGALVLHVGLVLSASPMHPILVEPLLPDAAHAPVDEHVEAARIYAPWIMHETDEALGRQDIPSAMDFDGDRLGVNHWESFPRYEILPTVYYTYAETDTHLFLTYHLFHPRDWKPFALGYQDTHEGDGENLQVVVEKANASVVLVTTQAHYDAWSYAPLRGPIRSGAETIRAEFEIATGHPMVYVESEGHGIYGSLDPRAANRLARIGDPVVIHRPANEGEALFEPKAPWNESAPYRLVSLPAFLANATRHEGLFAGYEDVEGRATPRYHKGDRYSGPLGASRGISPFALGFGWSDAEFSSLFWTPAERYLEAYEIDGAWSTHYVVTPFE